LIRAFREFFYDREKSRSTASAYNSFAGRVPGPGSSVLTFNYDIAIERALKQAGKWDIGDGYGFPIMYSGATSAITVYKLHGSVNWFKDPLNDVLPPVIFPRDLGLLGYEGLTDPRIVGDSFYVDESGTFILLDPKKSFHWEKFWEPLWKAAATRLRVANEVFIHGYSMPHSDVRARELIFDNIDRSCRVNIHCRKTSGSMAEEFRDRGFTDVRPFPNVDFEAWVSAEEFVER
jgi:hypothetical protein